jgi:hypothetical protein
MTREHPQDEPRTWERSTFQSITHYFGICFLICFIGGVGFAFGRLSAEGGAYNKQYHEERVLIEPLLATDPAFSKVQCSARSNGGVALVGTVPTQADRDRLREWIVRFVGEKRADEIVLAVGVFR